MDAMHIDAKKVLYVQLAVIHEGRQVLAAINVEYERTDTDWQAHVFKIARGTLYIPLNVESFPELTCWGDGLVLASNYV